MNNLQKERITLLRANGDSYAKIAEALGISINTIKSYCRRNNLGGVAPVGSKSLDDTFCHQCGAPLKHNVGKKQKRFCSDKCRMSWWNSHPEKMNRKATREFICQTCGQVFEAYGKRERKYCSRTCYGKSKTVQL
jgi:transcriptional regulator with XRE-family HTH domain